MKQPKISDLSIDAKGTKRMRAEAARSKKIKITIKRLKRKVAAGSTKVTRHY